jgi:hypothetical protein
MCDKPQNGADLLWMKHQLNVNKLPTWWIEVKEVVPNAKQFTIRHPSIGRWTSKTEAYEGMLLEKTWQLMIM